MQIKVRIRGTLIHEEVYYLINQKKCVFLRFHVELKNEASQISANLPLHLPRHTEFAFLKKPAPR